ncbi:putative uncharacterized protein DDB_G0277255 isoform X2 [Nilaparvata lugens]|uniref:putative uncharacterized protein DDB_G0277255 isoform X2 n=1 Tax=Nilaparvata lugens TaxID=108931 RepID=UPI00193EBA0D|nr:putative uncharacterized protein DDB_G0277255 isoform X2 [Nilaparvata lugens]
MFGTKLRSWMETHIVRSRKKHQQHRNKLQQQQHQQQSNLEQQQSPSPAESCAKLLSPPPTAAPHCSSTLQPSLDNHRRYERDSFCVAVVQQDDGKLESLAPMQLPHSRQSVTINNLSSPESAYSTGYSTDGTSPGASVPPEYYINIRTGTHYFQSQGECTGSAVASKQDRDRVAATVLLLTPRSARRRRDDVKEKKKTTKQAADLLLRESSTEEDLIEKAVVVRSPPPHLENSAVLKNKIGRPMPNSLHRRTESYDESRSRPELFGETRVVARPGDASSSQPANTDLLAAEKDSNNPPYQCSSPYLSSASPRQRNRIRTNPWLSGGQPPPQTAPKCYNSQGETSSTVGSSSTISSNGCHLAPPADTHTHSPRSNTKKKLAKDEAKSPAALAISPVVRTRRLVMSSSVTTCSPHLNRPCRHAMQHGRSPSSSSSTSSSTSSASSSASNDNHHGNTSDFSDDDVTLNEMLGKFDESYVYEKETDILSDSDPTDCDDYNGVNTGHCTYHHLPGHTPEMQKRLKDSVARRHRAETNRRHRDSSRGASRKRSSSQNKHKCHKKETEVSSSTEHVAKKTSARKRSSGSINRKSSIENVPRSFEQSGPLYSPTRRLVHDPDRRNLENPAKHFNLNRVLMERLINNQRNGTRSADGTPVSLRRNHSSAEYNGKYLRNHWVTKVMNSNPGFNERRNSFEGRLNSAGETKKINSLTPHPSPVKDRPFHDRPPVVNEVNEADKEGDLKYRRLIQEAENILEDFQGKTKPEYLSPTFRVRSANHSAPLSPLVMKCQKQAEMFKTANGDICNTQINNNMKRDTTFLIEKTGKDTSEVTNNNDEGLFKTISKTFERIIARNNTSDANKKLDKSVADPFVQKKMSLFVHAPPPPPIYENIARRGSTYSNIETFGNATCINDNASNHNNDSHRDDLSKFNDGYTFVNGNNNLSEFRKSSFSSRTIKKDSPSFIRKNSDYECSSAQPEPTNCQSNSCYLYDKPPRSPCRIDRSSNRKLPPNINSNRMQNLGEQVPWHHRNSNVQDRFKNQVDDENNFRKSLNAIRGTENQKPDLTAFRSFDLGNGNVFGTRYCPQSEPVKRKVYTCSATFNKLQKSLMRKNTHLANSASTGFKPTGQANDQNYNWKDKAAHLKNERLSIDSQVTQSRKHSDRQIRNDNIETG